MEHVENPISSIARLVGKSAKLTRIRWETCPTSASHNALCNPSHLVESSPQSRCQRNESGHRKEQVKRSPVGPSSDTVLCNANVNRPARASSPLSLSWNQRPCATRPFVIDHLSVPTFEPSSGGILLQCRLETTSPGSNINLTVLHPRTPLRSSTMTWELTRRRWLRAINSRFIYGRIVSCSSAPCPLPAPLACLHLNAIHPPSTLTARHRSLLPQSQQLLTRMPRLSAAIACHHLLCRDGPLRPAHQPVQRVLR
jgi:hypothetical protein